MLARGVHVDHSTVNRWVITDSPQLEEAFHRRKRPVWVSWCMDETYIKIKGTWYYRHRRARFRDEALRAGWGDAPRAVRPPWLSPPPPSCGGLLAFVDRRGPCPRSHGWAPSRRLVVPATLLTEPALPFRLLDIFQERTHRCQARAHPLPYVLLIL